jgi:hypothetical protein
MNRFSDISWRSIFLNPQNINLWKTILIYIAKFSQIGSTVVCNISSGTLCFSLQYLDFLSFLLYELVSLFGYPSPQAAMKFPTCTSSLPVVSFTASMLNNSFAIVSVFQKYINLQKLVKHKIASQLW